MNGATMLAAIIVNARDTLVPFTTPLSDAYRPNELEDNKVTGPSDACHRQFYSAMLRQPQKRMTDSRAHEKRLSSSRTVTILIIIAIERNRISRRRLWECVRSIWRTLACGQIRKCVAIFASQMRSASRHHGVCAGQRGEHISRGS